MTPVRRALLAMALGGFAIGTSEFAVIGLLPNIAGSFHVSIPHAGYLISAYALGVVVGAPLFTPLSVWVSHKRFLCLIAGLLAAGNIISAMMPGFVPLLVLRFLTALPHGAYFGVASVTASRLVAAERRSAAMSIIFAGLTVANVLGVPASTLIGQQLGWRLVFWLIGGFDLLSLLAVLLWVPARLSQHTPAEPVRLRHEVRALAQRPIWLALGIATIGGAGLFCSFSYVTPMMTHLAGFRSGFMTVLLMLFGAGMTAGNLVGARLADRALMPTILGALTTEAVVAAVFFFAVHNKIGALVCLFLFPSCALAMLPALQSRIVSQAGGAPNLSAASIHAAFNIANSIGAWVGGALIAAGLGLSSPNLAAAAFALLGVGVASLSIRSDRHHQSPAVRPAAS